jgi:hypothetical protein
LKSSPLSDNGGRFPGLGGKFPEPESGVSIKLIDLSCLFQQAASHDTNIANGDWQLHLKDINLAWPLTLSLSGA